MDIYTICMRACKYITIAMLYPGFLRRNGMQITKW